MPELSICSNKVFSDVLLQEATMVQQRMRAKQCLSMRKFTKKSGFGSRFRVEIGGAKKQDPY